MNQHEWGGDLVSLCGDHNLQLNIGKTKEMIIDFRSGEGGKPPLETGGKPVEKGKVKEFKFLCTIMPANLTWGSNVYKIAKLAHQRLYSLLKLKTFPVSRKAMVQFYTSVV